MNDTQPMANTPQQPEPAARDHAADTHTERRVRTSPIFWGALFLVVCAWAVQQQFFVGIVSTGVWIASAALGLGLILLIVGIGVAVRSSHSRR